MNKIKKLFISMGVFFSNLVSKVSAVPLTEQTKYGVYNQRIVEEKYGVFEPTMGEKISNVGKIALPIILFIIGLFVVLNKKITKKVKAIIISILVILGVLGYILMNYIATNF